MTPRRLTSNHIWQMSEGLSPRDLSIVETLARVRIASVDQLQRLHFPNQARTARRAVQELTKRRILTRMERNVGGERAGSAGHIYTLDIVGQHLAKRGGPAGGQRFRRPWTPGRMFVSHMLAVTDIYVGLVEAERAAKCELLDFQSEPECWRDFGGIGGGRLTLKPDAFVRLGVGEFEDAYFLEVDLGTESLPAIVRKASVYRQYWAGGSEQSRTGVFPRVLWIVPDEKRRDSVRRALSSRVAAEPQLDQVAVVSGVADVLFAP